MGLGAPVKPGASAGSLRLLSMTETQFTDTVVDIARTYRWKVTHFRPARTARGWSTPLQGDPGFVDLVLAKSGVVILAELKVGRNKPRQEQVAWALAIGQQYRLWYPKDIPAIIEELSR